MISKYALDCKPYNTYETHVTWETCSLRKWLNSGFINDAFSAVEKSMIPTVKVSADENLNFSTNQGNDTKDKIFLLSIKEANRFFSANNTRHCKPTDYASAQGVFVDRYNGNCMWWLRSSGRDQCNATGVGADGGIAVGGNFVDLHFAVRPAMWIDLNS